MIILYWLILQHTFANVHINGGFFLIKGEPKYNKDIIFDTDIVFCRGMCSLTSEDLQLSFAYKGFNTISNISRYTKLGKKWESFKNAVQVRGQNINILDTEKKSVVTNKSDESIIGSVEGGKDDVLNIEENLPSALSYTYPYPTNRSIFLHRLGGKIFFLPKEFCETVCVGFVNRLGAKKSYRVTFTEGQRPIWSIQISGDIESEEYQWFFEDGDKKQTYRFFILKNTPNNFKRALANDVPIEIFP